MAAASRPEPDTVGDAEATQVAKNAETEARTEVDEGIHRMITFQWEVLDREPGCTFELGLGPACKASSEHNGVCFMDGLAAVEQLRIHLNYTEPLGPKDRFVYRSSLEMPSARHELVIDKCNVCGPNCTVTPTQGWGDPFGVVMPVCPVPNDIVFDLPLPQGSWKKAHQMVFRHLPKTTVITQFDIIRASGQVVLKVKLTQRI